MAKEDKYREFVKRHIINVRRAWELFKERDEFQEKFPKTCSLRQVVCYQIAFHDQSKFHKDEFRPYQRKFFPEPEDENNSAGVQEAFLRALNYHHNANGHHWEHWVLTNRRILPGVENLPLKMPKAYALEMLMNWTAKGYQRNILPSDWYLERRQAIQLHADTRRFVERWLPECDQVYLAMKYPSPNQ